MRLRGGAPGDGEAQGGEAWFYRTRSNFLMTASRNAGKDWLYITCLKATNVHSAEGTVWGPLVVVAEGDGTLHTHAVATGSHSHVGLPAAADGALFILIITHGSLMVT